MIPNRALKLVVLLAFGATGVACKSSDVPRITVLGEDSSNVKAMRTLRTVYESATKVRLEFNADEFNIANQKANTDLANHTGVYDLILQYNFSLASFSRNRFVLFLDEQHHAAPSADFSFEPSLFAKVWREIGFYYIDAAHPSVGEQAIGYPFSANTMMLVFNKRLFDDDKHKRAYQARFHEELRVPTSWTQFAHIAEYFGTSSGTHGVSLQGASGGWLYYEWMNFLFGMGGTTMQKDRGWKGDIDTPVLLDSAEARTALGTYLRLQPYNAGDFFSTDATRQRDQMRVGNTAMAIMWSDYVFDLVHRPDGSFDGSFGFAPIPGTKSMIAGGAFYVNRWSAHPKEAVDFVSYVLQPETQAKLMALGLCSPSRDAYSTPEAKSLPYRDALFASLERGVYMLEAGPDADAISEVITQQIQRAWRAEVSSEAALSEAVGLIKARRQEIYAKLRSQ